MIMLDNFEEMKREHALIQQRIAKAQGALGEIMRQLRENENFNVSTIKDAKKLLADLQKKTEEYRVEYLKKKEEYEQLMAQIESDMAGLEND